LSGQKKLLLLARGGEDEWMRSSQELGDQFGVSASTIDRVCSIMEHGTQEQIQFLNKDMIKILYSAAEAG
jgi:hypothetical protein